MPLSDRTHVSFRLSNAYVCLPLIQLAALLPMAVRHDRWSRVEQQPRVGPAFRHVAKYMPCWLLNALVCHVNRPIVDFTRFASPKGFAHGSG